jgi:hypothetical protein
MTAAWVGYFLIGGAGRELAGGARAQRAGTAERAAPVSAAPRSTARSFALATAPSRASAMSAAVRSVSRRLWIFSASKPHRPNHRQLGGGLDALPPRGMTHRKNERYSKASVVSVVWPALPPLSGLIVSCKWLIESALIDHSSCSSVVPGGLKLYS